MKYRKLKKFIIKTFGKDNVSINVDYPLYINIKLPISNIFIYRAFGPRERFFFTMTNYPSKKFKTQRGVIKYLKEIY